MHIALSIILVFGAVFLTEIAAHTALIAASEAHRPAPGPFGYLAGLALSRLGMALAFVGLWLMVRYDQVERIWTFVFFWWVMLAFYEVGQAIGPDYSWLDAVSGLVAASISLPLSGLIVTRLLRD